MIGIGTSGYSYPYWKNRFYPEKLAASKWLEYYATQFNTLELNNTFYRFPTAANLRKTFERTPEDFVFTVKAHKIITHTKRLKAAGDKIREFADIAREALREKLACILYQMPPSYSYSEERLEDILRELSAGRGNVIEFRHASWWKPEVYQLLDQHQIHFCSVSFPKLPEDQVVTGNLYYRRMHGVPNLFASSYSPAELEALAENMPNAPDQFVYFNNTMYEAGYENARLLQQLRMVQP